MISCCPCPTKGKYIIVTGSVFWGGNEGYNSDVTCPTTVCGSGFKSTANTRYRTVNVAISSSWSVSGWSWVWSVPDNDWIMRDNGSTVWSGINNGQGTWDPHKDDMFEDSRTRSASLVIDPILGSGDCSGAIGPFTGVGSAGWPSADTLELYAWESLGFSCGHYTAVPGPSGTTYFPGGTEADLIAYFSSGSAGPGVVVTMDAQTDTHIGFNVEQHNVYGPIAKPGPEVSHDTAVCGYVKLDASLTLSITLSNLYTYEMVCADATALLGNYSLHSPMADAAVHPIGSDCHNAGNETEPVHVLKWNGANGQRSGLPPPGYVPNPIYDGRPVGVFGERPPLEGEIAYPWGFLTAFVPDPSGPQKGGYMRAQKWAMRQGCYLAFGWQATPTPLTKVWSFMVQNWTFSWCDSGAVYTCGNGYGGSGFVMAMSPNTEDWGSGGGNFGFEYPPLERLQGGQCQGFCRDSMPDTYGLTWDPTGGGGMGAWTPSAPSYDATTYVEATCAQGCPSAAPYECQAPITGDCPGASGEAPVPDDNCA